MKLFHGTSRNRAKKILSDGFKRGKKASYTGTGINLSESITISYEYGAYESGGCVLEVELSDDANLENIGSACASDQLFQDNAELDAIVSYGGNVYVIWNTKVIKAIRIIPKKEALALLYKQFQEDGDNMAYNGYVQDHCDNYWHKEQEAND